MQARKVKDPQFLIPALGVAARIQLDVGRREEALALATELLHQANRVGDWRMVDIVFVARPLGLVDEFRRLLEALPPSRLREANLAIISADYGRAADLFTEAGLLWAAADALLLSGDAESVGQALAYYRSVGATRSIREAEALLAAAS